MVATRDSSSTKVHVLNSFTDEDNSSALTVLVNAVRFHIIADVGELKPSNEKGRHLQRQYHALAAAVRKESCGEQPSEDVDEDAEVASSHEESNEVEKDDEELWCTCRQPENGHRMVACEDESCQYTWFHFSCVGLDSAPLGGWVCPDCRQRGGEEHTRSTSACDSGVDVSTPEEAGVEAGSVKVMHSALEPSENAEQKLHNWILAPFASVFARLAPKKAAEKRTLKQWYTPPTYFYNVCIKGSNLDVVELEGTKELEERMSALTPRLAMLKYISNLDITWHTASDLVVLDESDALGPLHPSRVSVGDKEYFIKLVDDTQPGPTKREIKILKQIEKLGLHKEFNVPQVLGLVRWESSSSNEIMGFLQTDISSPTPLTEMVDTDVPQEKRDRWGREAERIIDLLHKNNVIFGDCKADNFLVDKHDELWIIDFGGSYTEGWIDPKLSETKQGDDMALQKIVGALDDPEANTIDEDDERDEQSVVTDGNGQDKTVQRKRKRVADTTNNHVDSKSEDARPTKEQKTS